MHFTMSSPVVFLLFMLLHLELVPTVDTKDFVMLWLRERYMYGDIMAIKVKLVYQMDTKDFLRHSVRLRITSKGQGDEYNCFLRLIPKKYRNSYLFGRDMDRKKIEVVTEIPSSVIKPSYVNKIITVFARHGMAKTVISPRDPQPYEMLIEIEDGKKNMITTKDLSYLRVPSVKASDQITLRILSPNSSYDYTMELYRINGYEDSYCVLRDQVGKIDLSTLNSLDNLEPGDVGVATTTLTFARNTLPHGFLRLVVHIAQNGNSITQIWRYFQVTEPHVVFYPVKSIWADDLTRPFGKDLVIDGNASFFTSTVPSYGIRPEFPATDTFTLHCATHDPICTNLTNLTQKVLDTPVFVIIGGLIRQNILTNNNVLLNLTWTSVSEGGTFVGAINSKVTFIFRDIEVDIECIRNCHIQYVPEIPVILRAKCANCDPFDYHGVEYKWKDPGFDAEGLNTVYLVINRATESFTASATVYYFPYGRRTWGGWAKKQISPIQGMPSLAVNYSIKASQSQTDFPTFDFTVGPILNQLSGIPANAAPIRRFLKTSDGLSIYSFTNQMPNVVLRSNDWSMNITLGLLTADRKEYSETIMATKLPDIQNKTMPAENTQSNNLSELCNRTSSLEEASRFKKFTWLFALAQEVSNDVVDLATAKMCWNTYHKMLEAKEMNPAYYRTVYRTLYLFFMKLGKARTEENILFITRNMEIIAKFLLFKTTQPTSEMEALVKIFFDVLGVVLKAPPILNFSKKLALVENILGHMRNSSMDLLHVHEKRNQLIIFPGANFSVYLWWSDMSSNESAVDVQYMSDAVEIRLKVSRDQVFGHLHALKPGQVQDLFVNFMVYISEDTIHQPKTQSALGTVELYTETKSTFKEIELEPKDHPITVVFKRKAAQKHAKKTMILLVKDGKPIDSACVLFKVRPSRLYNLTVHITLDSPFFYSLSYLKGRRIKDSYNIFSAPSQRIQHVKNIVLPVISKKEDENFPDTSYYFLLQVPVDNQTNNTNSLQNAGLKVQKSEEIYVSVFGTACLYFKDLGWREDSDCQPVQSQESHVIECWCYVDAPYTAAVEDYMVHYSDFKPIFIEAEFNLLPGTVVLTVVVLTACFGYWAYFQDRREEGNAHIHAVKGHFRLDSHEFYLVCISTGMVPGSGTRNRVSFLLVGETGSSQVVMPQGDFCFSTGSNIWFLVSSDLNLGPIMGITINYDTYINGVELSPWVLQRVIVYSQSFNQVIKFEANRKMDARLPSYVMAAVPCEPTSLEETFMRFRYFMRTYHTLTGSFFSQSGTGISKCQRATVFCAVMTFCLRLTYENHKPIAAMDPADETILVYLMYGIFSALLTCIFGLILKFVFSCVFAISPRVIWPKKLMPESYDELSEVFPEAIRRHSNTSSLSTRVDYFGKFFSASKPAPSDQSSGTDVKEEEDEPIGDILRFLKNNQRIESSKMSSAIDALTSHLSQGHDPVMKTAPTFAKHSMKKSADGTFDSYVPQKRQNTNTNQLLKERQIDDDTDGERNKSQILYTDSGQSRRTGGFSSISKDYVQSGDTICKHDSSLDKSDARVAPENFSPRGGNYLLLENRKALLSRKYSLTQAEGESNAQFGKPYFHSKRERNEQDFDFVMGRRGFIAPNKIHKYRRYPEEWRHITNLLALDSTKQRTGTRNINETITGFRRYYFQYFQNLNENTEGNKKASLTNTKFRSFLATSYPRASLDADELGEVNGLQSDVQHESRESSSYSFRNARGNNLRSEHVKPWDKNSLIGKPDVNIKIPDQAEQFTIIQENKVRWKGCNVYQRKQNEQMSINFTPSLSPAVDLTSSSHTTCNITAGGFQLISAPFRWIASKILPHCFCTNVTKNTTSSQILACKQCTTSKNAFCPTRPRHRLEYSRQYTQDKSWHDTANTGKNKRCNAKNMPRSSNISGDKDFSAKPFQDTSHIDKEGYFSALSPHDIHSANGRTNRVFKSYETSPLVSYNKSFNAKTPQGSPPVTVSRERQTSGPISIDPTPVEVQSPENPSPKPAALHVTSPEGIQSFAAVGKLTLAALQASGFSPPEQATPVEIFKEEEAKKSAEKKHLETSNTQNEKVDKEEDAPYVDNVSKIFEIITCLGSLKWTALQYLTLILVWCGIIYCGNSVTLQGYNDSFKSSIQWLQLLAITLFLVLCVFEEVFCMCFAAMSFLKWRHSFLLIECMHKLDVVFKEIDRQRTMVELGWAPRHRTAYTHLTPAPYSSSLFYLLAKVYEALKRSIPKVIFHRGVYWLIIYTLNILVMINLQTNIPNGNAEKLVIYKACGLDESKEVITVDRMWNFIEKKLYPCLEKMQVDAKVDGARHNDNNATRTTMGAMLISAIRINQLRTTPLSNEDSKCFQVPVLSKMFDEYHQCNYDLSGSNLETRSFGIDWQHLAKSQTDHLYSYGHGRTTILSAVNYLGNYGYRKIMYLEPQGFIKGMSILQSSDWVDQHTRYLVVDVSMLNINSYMASSVRIEFDFERSAPIWHTSSYHFLFSISGVNLILNRIIFKAISALAIVKELYGMYYTGLSLYFRKPSNYVELFKIIISLLLIILSFGISYRKSNLAQEIKDSYILRDKSEYVDFLPEAIMESYFVVLAGTLAMICLFQLFANLGKIPRLAIFNSFALEALKCLYIPILGGMTFAFVGHVLFTASEESFSTFLRCYLNAIQFFIKPPKIHDKLNMPHPYVGPTFVLLLGCSITISLEAVFVAFMNEAYTLIRNKLFLKRYKKREKKIWELVKEFLGARIREEINPGSTLSAVNLEVKMIEKDRKRDRHLMSFIKRHGTSI